MKLFASDFDGTFYFWKKNDQVFEENVKTVIKFQEKNVFAIVTGRTPRSILCNLKSTGLKPNYIAGFNGGIVCDSDMNILYQDFPELDIVKIKNILKEERVKSFSFFSKNHMYVRYYRFSFKDLKFMNHYANLNGCKVTYNMNKVDLNSISMATLVCVDEDQARRIHKKLVSLNMKCNAYMNHNCIDIVGINASKQKAVEIIANHMNASEIYTIGDSYNDISMIEYYGGFTLNHASDEVKQVANKVVDSVASAINEIMEQE